MALINCPECGNQVSDQAQSCPECGYVIQGTLADPFTREEVKQGIKLGKGASIVGLFIIGIAYLAAIIYALDVNATEQANMADSIENVMFVIFGVSLFFLWSIFIYLYGHVCGWLVSIILASISIVAIFGIISGILESFLPNSVVDFVITILAFVPVVLFVIYLVKNIKASNEVLEKI